MTQTAHRKRVALLTPGGVGDEDSGVHIPAHRDLVERLSARYDVHIFSLAPKDFISRYGTCGNARVRYFPLHHRNRTAKKIWLLFNACKNEHRVHAFDIVHAFWAIPCGITAVLLGKRLGIPSIVNFLGGETASLPQIGYGNMFRLSTRLTTHWVARSADALVTLTRHQTQELENLEYSPSTQIIVPFGADKNLFVATEKDISQRPLRLLHVGNLHAIKDQTMLLMTFQQIARSVDTQLKIIGEGEMGTTLRDLARAMGVQDKIEFLGHVPHKELPQYYNWAHILLHTSLHEAQGVVIAEAASSGVLVAGTRTGLIADFGETMAVQSTVSDFKTLADKILDAASQPEKYNAMRGKALQWANQHDADWTFRQYSSLYDSL